MTKKKNEDVAKDVLAFFGKKKTRRKRGALASAVQIQTSKRKRKRGHWRLRA